MDKQEFDDFPIFLKPRLRIFLSADLIGSTALKHDALLPLRVSEDEAEGAPRWLASISDFYFNFAEHFRIAWNATAAEMTATDERAGGEAPEQWKAIGDELIYTKEIENRQQLVTTIRAWVSAIREYRKELDKPGRLDVKSYCWTAGFPVLNSEVVFSRGELEDDKYKEDARLRNF